MYSLNCSAIYSNKGSCIVNQNVKPPLGCMFLDQWLFQKCLKTVQTRLDRINTESLLINKGFCHDFSTLKTWLSFQLRGRPNCYLISSHCLYCPELFFKNTDPVWTKNFITIIFNVTKLHSWLTLITQCFVKIYSDRNEIWHFSQNHLHGKESYCNWEEKL